jgi:hypothetical protein
MTPEDRELLELAAKAAGLQIHSLKQSERDAAGFGHVGLWITGGNTCWNPLADDAEALRLAAKLYLWEPVRLAHRDVSNTVDIYAATRRAIVRAAAEIGRSMT